MHDMQTMALIFNWLDFDPNQSDNYNTYLILV